MESRGCVKSKSRYGQSLSKGMCDPYRPSCLLLSIRGSVVFISSLPVRLSYSYQVSSSHSLGTRGSPRHLVFSASVSLGTLSVSSKKPHLSITLTHYLSNPHRNSLSLVAFPRILSFLSLPAHILVSRSVHASVSARCQAQGCSSIPCNPINPLCHPQTAVSVFYRSVSLVLPPTFVENIHTHNENTNDPSCLLCLSPFWAM